MISLRTLCENVVNANLLNDLSCLGIQLGLVEVCDRALKDCKSFAGRCGQYVSHIFMLLI